LRALLCLFVCLIACLVDVDKMLAVVGTYYIVYI
jgi:hypothetical protein